jgi:hypothetical protein
MLTSCLSAEFFRVYRVSNEAKWGRSYEQPQVLRLCLSRWNCEEDPLRMTHLFARNMFRLTGYSETIPAFKENIDFGNSESQIALGEENVGPQLR